MKKSLLISTLAIAACAVLAYAGTRATTKHSVEGVKKAATEKALKAANKAVNKADEGDGEYEVVLMAEDFTKFTAGSEATPDATDVTDADTGLIADELTDAPGWSGYGVFQAGGCAYIGMVEYIDGEETGYISTPTFTSTGNLVISFRARVAEEGASDAVSAVSVDDDATDYSDPMAGVLDYNEAVITDEWNTYEIEVKGGATNTFVQLYSYEYPIFIDDIVVKEVESVEVPAPTALAATNVTPTSFTANWEEVEGADRYLLSVFSATTTDSGVEETTVTEGFDGIVASDSKGKFIDTEKSTFPEGWTLSLSENGTSRQIYTSNGNYNSAGVALAFDATGDYIETPTAPAPISEFSFWVKSQGAGEGSIITVSGFNGTEWIELGDLDFGDLESNFADFVGLDVDEEGIVKLRFEYTKVAGNCAIDDVSYTYGGDIINIDYVLDGEEVNGTSYDVTGLEAGKQYYYYVEAAIGSNYSDASNIIEVDGEGAVAEIAASAAKVAATTNGIEISLAEAAPVAVYSADGKLLYNAAAGSLTHSVALSGHGLYLVKIGDKTTKIAR